MTLQTRPDPKLIRASIALVWLYEGLWCKLLGGMPRHAEVIAVTPFLGPVTARAVLNHAAEFLEGCPPSTYDAFALSNIGDGASQEYLRRLRNAVEHAAAPNAVVVSRTFVEPRPDYHDKLGCTGPFDALGCRVRGCHHDLR